MGETIQHVTTPLALAGLALLVGAGLARSMLREHPNALHKMMVRYGVALAVALSVIANVSYIIGKRLESESAIAGTIRDTNGETIGQATIDVPAAGRTITQENGTFWMSIPASRRRDYYEITVTAPGFSPKRTLVSADEADGLELRLARVQPSAENTVAITSDLLVTHYLGGAEIDVPIQFHNVTSATLTLKDFSVQLTGPGGTAATLVPAAMYVAPGMPMLAALTTVILLPGQTLDGVWVFFRPDAQGVSVSQAVMGELYGDARFRQFGPRIDQQVLAPSTVAELSRFFDQQFIWKEGAWKFAISFTAGSIRLSKQGTFELTGAQVTSMRNLRAYYGAGYGLVFDNHLANVGDAVPVQRVRLNEATVARTR